MHKLKKHKIHKSISDKTFDIITNIMAFIAAFITIYPLYFVLLASISNPSAINSGDALLFPVDANLSAYRHILKDSRIWSGYANTIFYTSGSTFFGVMITILGGYALSRKDLIGRNYIMKILVFTMYFNGGLIPTYMVIKNLGLVNTRFV
jgi:putative aldouronate transport system permease protein